MTSRTSVLSDDFLQEMQALSREPSSPAPVPLRSRKHPRTNSTASRASDNEDDDIPGTPLTTSSSGATVNGNVALAIKNYAKKQKLRGEQQTLVDMFINDVQTIRNAKLFITLLTVQNDLQRIIAAAPPYAVSPALKVNIQSYAMAVLLSPKLGMYKGNMPVQHVFNIIKKHRFDTPPSFENNPAETAKIVSIIQDVFTQGRSRLKKLLFASVHVMRNHQAVDLDPEDHQNLFGLAQAFVDSTKCHINAPLCGRIALMRKVYLKQDNTTFWDELDKALAIMRTAAKGNEDARDLMFEGLIKKDKSLHGNVDIVYQASDDIQQEVDDVIAASSVDAAITVDLGAGQDDDGSDRPAGGAGEGTE
ncbi:hypothetical protein B0H10DRAFT_2185638 [Mycena sp. CBHHK59/15]|nr:hypothetical protein B0H10DRAFT_2185638 [Mycena sp. CBHHK59/15]